MKIISLPENVKLVTGEEEDRCLLQFRAKLYRLHTTVSVGASSSSSSEEQKVDSSSCSALLSGNAEHSEHKPNDTLPEHSAVATIAGGQSQAQEHRQVDASNAEWVEVGIGPLKVLHKITAASTAQAFDNPHNYSYSHSHGFETTLQNGRLVMRREEKQGGIGEQDYSFSSLIDLCFCVCMFN